MSNVLKAKVDFGDASDDRLLPSFDREGMKPGVAVILYDDDGNQCDGIVSRVDALLSWIEPIWNTWVPDDTEKETMVQ